MTTVMFAKNVKDLAGIMLRDTTEDKTYIKYSVQSFTEKIYADPQAGKAWRDARLRFNYNMDWDTNEEREQKYAAWESENPEPQNIIFTNWYLEYKSGKWRTEKIVYLSPKLGREIDNHWTTRWDEVARVSVNVGTLTMATILKRLEVETKHLLRARREELKQDRMKLIRQNQIAHLGYISEDIEKSIQRFTELGVDNLSGLMSHLQQANAQIKLAIEVVERDCK